VYTPSAAEKLAGTVTLTLTTDDPTNACGPAADTVTITLTNTPPVASNFTMGVQQGGTTSVTIIAGKYDPSDADGDPLTVTAANLVTPANGGSVSVVGGTAVTYAASASFSGTDSFTYVVSDGFGGSGTGTVTVVVSPAGGGLNITGISVTGVTVTVTAMGVPGATYRLQYTAGLMPASWQAVLGSDQVAATNGTMTLLHTDTGAVPPVRYYSTLHVSGP
jgi:hypothetical protein